LPVLTLVFVSFCACSSNFQGNVFETDELAFRLRTVPPAWRRIEADGVLLAFRDDEGLASVAVNGRCGKDGDDVPLQALTHHLFLYFSDREIHEQRRVPLDGREALYTDLTATLDGVEKRYTVVVLKKNGCVYDFMYVAPPSAPADGHDRFTTFVRGFATLRP
jgi:hypothetical protein